MNARASPAIVAAILCLTGCSQQDRTESSAEVSPPGVGQADSGASPSAFDSLFAGAQETYFAGEYDSALVVFEQIRRRAGREGESAAEARALTWIGLAHWKLGNHEQSRVVGEQALALKVERSLVDQYFESFNALGLLAWTENRLSDSEQWLERAIAVASEAGDRRNRAKAVGNLALVQTELGQFSQARSGFETMQAATAEMGEVRLEANALNNLGMLEIRLGDPRTAIPLLHRALALYDSIDYDTGTQSALGQLGVAYTDLGDPGQAFAALDSALALAEYQGLEQEQASILEAMAELYRAAGDFSRALELYDSAKAINAELGLDIETGADLRGEADIYVRLGDLTRARDTGLQALAIHRAAGAPMEVLLDLLILAGIHDRLDESEAVARCLNEARSVASDLGARVARVELGLSEARIADRHRRSSEVLEIIDRIEADLARGGYSAEWEARLLESRARERLGQAEQAAQAGRRALATVERVRQNYSSGTLRTALVADKREVYEQLISVLLRLGQVDEAFVVADAARGRVLLERLAAAGQAVAPGSSPNTDVLSDGELLLSRIDRLVESIDYMEQTPPGELTPDQASELESLYGRLTQARREYEGLLVLAAETAPDESAFLGGTRADPAAVRAALGPGQLLVEYFVPLDGQVIVFAVSRDEIRVMDSPISATNLASRVRLTRDLMARSESEGERLDFLLGGLYEALLEPLLNAGLLSAAQELIVVPHRELVYLPFAALLDRTTGRYIIQDFSLRVLPSAAALPVLARRSMKIASQVRGSAFAPLADQLPGTRLELRGVTDKNGRVRSYVGSRATERAVRMALGQPGLVHVATHGVLNIQNPMFSRLEFARGDTDDTADDGRLEVHELLGLPVAAPLVFLSGCETGAGGAHSTVFAPGEDYATLAQAFLYAGAGNVIATLWPVDDAGAAEFADQFYRHLIGDSPDRALAEAQRSMLAQERYGNPFFWAAYQLAGYDGGGRAHMQAGFSVPLERAPASQFTSGRPRLEVQ